MVNIDELNLLDKDELIALLAETAAEKGVKLSFPGKALARRISRKVRPHCLKAIDKYSAGSPEDRARNVLIEGDNLQAMATLYRERGQIDLILTDPPYNTGNDFRYNDKWETDPDDLGMGTLVSGDDFARHTKWMKFMFPRLLLMKQLLKPNGVLAICIDHRELFHLGQMLDEIFGEENRLAIINWQKSYAPRNDNRHVSTSTEYVLVYAKDERLARTGLDARTEAMNARYQSPDGDSRLWTDSDLSAPGAGTHQGMVYAIQNPFTGDLIYPPTGRCWGLDRCRLKEALEGWGVEYQDKNIHDDDVRALICGVSLSSIRKNVKALVVNNFGDESVFAARTQLEQGPWPIVFFRGSGEGFPRLKRFLEDVKQGRVPQTYWSDEGIDEPEVLGDVSWPYQESGHSQAGVNELSAIVGKGHGFDTVKPLKLFQKIISLWCPPDGIVFDPFAGSGTTGHAVLYLNKETEAKRRFILVEQGRPENGDSYARSLTADRLSRVIKGSWENGKGLPLAGGYEFRELLRKIDAEAVLAMARDEMVDIVISSYFVSSRRKGPNLIRITEMGYRYLVAKNEDNEGFYLIWDGPDSNTDFDEDVYEQCVLEGEKAGLKSQYHVYARFQLLVTSGVHFYQIPDQILADFGLDVQSESYAGYWSK